MSQVITFEDYTPIARFDAIPWTDARIDEAPTSLGSWTTIDTIALSPVDSDPSNPASRDFTTNNASDTAALWYRVVFVDGSGNTSPPSLPVQNIDAGTTEYVTSDELKTALSLADQTYADDDIGRACAAASRAIDNRLGRFFYTTTDVRYYTPSCYDDALDVIDLQSVTELAIDAAGNNTFSTLWTEDTDFFLEPFNAAETGRPFDVIRIRHQSGRTWPTYQRSVRVTGTFGWASVPDPVNQYALILASKLLDRARKSPNGVIVYGLDAPIATRISRNDPDFELLLGDYMKAKPGF